MQRLIPLHSPRLFLLLATLLLAGIQPSQAQRGPTTLYRGAEASANTVIVQLLETHIQADIQGARLDSKLRAAREALGAQVTSRIARKNIEEWTISTDVETALAQLNAVPGVKAYPNLMLRMPEPVDRRVLDEEEFEQPFPNDPGFAQLWGLNNDGSFESGYSVEDVDIDAPEAWEVTKGSHDVAVVVFDTGIDYTHPDLADNMWVNPGEDLDGDGVVQEAEFNGVDDDGNGYVDDFFGWDPASDTWDIMDEDGHGTHVSGTIGAVGDNSIGVVGVNLNVSIIGVDILNGTVMDILEAYEYVSVLLEQGVPIVSSNQSWGFNFPGLPQVDPSVLDFVELIRGYALEHSGYGLVWVCSAGNDAFDNDVIPGFRIPSSVQSPNVISVGAMDSADFPASFTSFGRFTVDIGAPGVRILSTYPGGYAFAGGTSMASPHVAGAVALASTVYPGESVLDRVARVMATGVFVEGYDALWRTGARVNVNNMVNPTVGGSNVLLAGATGLIFKAFGDEEGIATVGFVNATSADITITDASISGEDAAVFDLFEEGLDAEPVAPGEAYGLSVVFRPTEGAAQRRYEATLTLATGGGSDVVIELSGLDQPVAIAELDPATEVLGPVPMGVTLESTTTLSNSGDFPLQFVVAQGLVTDDETLTEAIAERRFGIDVPKRDETEDRKAELPSVAALDQMTHQVESKVTRQVRRTLSLDDLTPAHGVTAIDDPNLALAYFDDFDDLARVDTTWQIVDNGDLEFDEPSQEVWELELINEAGENYAMLAGDLDGMLSPATWTVAVSPWFDFTGLPIGRRPYYLTFDYAAELDGVDQRFFVYAYAGGEFQGILAHTGTNLEPDGAGHSIIIDVGFLAGMTDVRLYFVAFYADTEPTGFGTLFDNVGIVTGDAEYFASTYEGVVEPGESQEVTVSVRTGLLPEGDYSLFTDFTTLAVNAFALEHELIFTVVDSDLLAAPLRAFIEEPLSRGEQATSTFTLTNTLGAEVSFTTASVVTQMDARAFDLEPGDESFVADVMARARSAHRQAKVESQDSQPMRRRTDRIDPRLVQKPRVPEDVTSQVLMQDAHVQTLFYEGFEDSLAMPLYWTVIDQSDGEGSVWHVEDIGAPGAPMHVAAVGDLGANPPQYQNNTATALVTPPIAVADLDEDEALFLEFAYAVALEEGFDFLEVVALGFDGDGQLVDDREVLLAASEPGFGLEPYSSGVNLSAINLSSEVAYVQVEFFVTSDGSVSEGFTFIDDVMIFSAAAPTDVTPARGTIAGGATQDFELHIDASMLRPGSYVATALVDYMVGDEAGQAEHLAFFEVINRPPTAVADTIAVAAGDVISLEMLGEVLVANDFDTDGDSLWIGDVTDPLRGELKSFSFADTVTHYVAPEDFDGYDLMQYKATDGSDLSNAAEVVIEVHAFPQFITGMQQNFAMLEDDSLRLNTMMMASGVGGLDEEVIVWAETHVEWLVAVYHPLTHTLALIPEPNAYGQFDVTLYVGHEDEPTDTVDVTVVVAPVNDPPMAAFEFDVDGPQVSFTSTANDAFDPEGAIVSYEWAFADGTTSTEPNPTHSYAQKGEYDVMLTVTDDAGASATTTQQVVVPTGTALASEEVPSEFVLEQNYPNPFNPATTVRFGLPEAQSVTLRVYNALGQVVRTFYDGATLAPGYHDVSIDASRLASGLYLYELEAIGLDGARTLLPAKKMVLVK